MDWTEQRYWEDVTEGEALPTLKFPLTIYRLVMSAGATRDYNAIHHNSAFANKSGAPDMYANGLLLQAMWERSVREFIGLAGVIRALRGFWLTDARLQSIRTPTLIVGAGLDAGHFGPTAAMSSALHDRIPASTLRIAPDYGTLMLLEAPQEFWRLARPFYADMAEQAGR